MAVAAFLVAFSAVGVPSSAKAQPLTGVYRGEVYSQPNAVNADSAWLGFDVAMAQGHQAKDTWGNIENPSWQLGHGGRG